MLFFPFGTNRDTLSQMNPTEALRIQSSPDVCGGYPCVAGTRVRVLDVYVSHEIQGMTPDEILFAHPNITLPDVHLALAYSYLHREDILKQLQDERNLVAAIRARVGSGPLETMLGKDANAQVPS